VRKDLYILMPMGQATIEQVARGRGMNVRTLQRRLEEANETFSEPSTRSAPNWRCATWKTAVLAAGGRPATGLFRAKFVHALCSARSSAWRHAHGARRTGSAAEPGT
jgi:hypothetical protein